MDRVRGAVKDVREELDKANVRLVTIGKTCVFLMEKVLDLTESIERMHERDDIESCSSPEKKRRLNGPRSIEEIHDSKFDSGSLVLPGLFNGEWEGERCDGEKRSTVFFRLLCKNMYPTKEELLEEFLCARCDVKEKAVRKWFKLNDDGLTLRLRSRRSALSRYIKSNVIQALGGTEMPPEKGDPMVTAEWVEDGRQLWLNAKIEARATGLLYPTCVTKTVLRHAKQSDSSTQYTVSCPPADSQDLWWKYLIGMEAYFLFVMTAVFGEHTSDYIIQLKRETLCGDAFVLAVQIVLKQRDLVEQLVDE